jgi:hypothetical protein|nr:MAG TPA: Transcription initiation factor IIE, alpha FINGER, Transcription [Caudoviricetes sp.]
MKKEKRMSALIDFFELAKNSRAKTIDLEGTKFPDDVDLIVEALEKQVSKSPIDIQDDFGDFTLCCPSCKRPIVNVWNRVDYKPIYCHVCGQKLDWEDI